MTSRRYSTLLSCTLLCLLLAACAAPPEKIRVLWPAPPERPRLEWLQNYYSEDDFPKSSTRAAAEGLLGKPPRTVFSRPFGIAADVERNLVYVADSDLQEVRYYDLTNYVIRRLNEVTPFGRPLGMTLDRDGNLYVCDGLARSVMVFGPDHQPRYNIGGPEVFQLPAYVEVNDRLGRVYVADGKASKIVVFDRAGGKLFEIGGFGGAPGEFRSPQGLAIDKDNRLFVADMLNARVQVLDADGKFLYMFGERTDRFSGFEAPKDLAFDSEGNLHILDTRKSALLSYSADGKLLLHTGGKGASNKPIGFSVPSAIWIGQDDRLYITDSFNRRFSVWQYLSDAYLAKHPIK